MPEHCADGTVVLSAQGLPFAVAGVGDLLALFRCVSVRYRFSTDVMKPSLMGAIGRVYATLEPEMSHDVQKYDKQVYLRVSEAQRCRVHSTLVVPIFDRDSTDKPLAVFELVQSDKDVAFPAVIQWLKQCLENVSLSTANMDSNVGGPAALGLKQWPMAIENAGSPEPATTRVEPGSSRGRGGDEHMEETSGSQGVKVKAEPSMISGRDVTRLSRDNEAARKEGDGSVRKGMAFKPSDAGAATEGGSTRPAPGPGASSAPQAGNKAGGGNQVHQLVSWMNENGLTPQALDSLRSLMSTSTNAPATNNKGAARNAGGTTAATGGGGRRKGGNGEEEEEDDFSSEGNDDDDSSDGGKGGGNRTATGAGKRLRFEDLQAQFGYGLKEAATNLGICATTLKRACRRHGIKRWPRRQITKLSKALTSMGYQGAPPPGLVQSAVTGQLTQAEMSQAAAAAMAAKQDGKGSTGDKAGSQQQSKPASTAQPAGSRSQQSGPGNGTSASPQVASASPPLPQSTQQAQQSQQATQQQQPQQQQAPSTQMQGQQQSMAPMQMPGGHPMQGGPGMMMMPQPGMAAAHMMAAGMAAGMAGMQGHMGQAMMPGMFPHQGMPHMMAPTSQPLMPGPYGNPYMQAAQQHAANMQQQRMAAGFAPGMAFMYNDMDRPVASVPQPLVHELAAGLAHMPPPMLGMSGQHSSNAMQISSSALLPVINKASLGDLGNNSEMNVASGMSLPPSDIMALLDGGHTSHRGEGGQLQGQGSATQGGGGGTGAGGAGRGGAAGTDASQPTSQSQFAALHEYFRNGNAATPNSLDNFMDLLSDHELPPIPLH